MTIFVQLHLLTAYPASNLNRDDTGSPKTVRFGGAERLRVSSQSLKRAIRTSDLFADAIGKALDFDTPTFEAAMGKSLSGRSKTFPALILDEIIKVNPKLGSDVPALAEKIKSALAKAKGNGDGEEGGDSKKNKGKLGIGSVDPKSVHGLYTKEAVQLGPDEFRRLETIAARIASGEAVDPKQYALLLDRPKAVDIAMFGRMLADAPAYNVEAAVQVAHAFTTHRVTVEDDYYTAVDDLKNADRTEDRGAGFIGIQEYGAGLFYLYVCIDADLLVRNLSGDTALAKKAIAAFIEAAAKVSPKGKQNSYASRGRASYVMGEAGPEAPRTLAAAFLKPVTEGSADGDIARASIQRLETLRDQFGVAYGDKPMKVAVMDVAKWVTDVANGKKANSKKGGTLAEVIELAEGAIDAIAA
jgi:CRISPR system Cascade subunit CasC